MNRRNLISKKTGIGDHMIADKVTDILFPLAERYIDIVKIEEKEGEREEKLGQCIGNQYVSIDWIKCLIGRDEWKDIGKERAVYEYFVDDDSTMKPNMKNIDSDDDDDLYIRASGDMQYDFDDLNDVIIEDIKRAFIEVSKKSPVYKWFEYSWSHNNEDHKESGCHVRIYMDLKLKTKLEWGFYYIHYLNGLLKYVNKKYVDDIVRHIDWSCCSVTRGFSIPYNKGGVTLGKQYDKDEINIICDIDLLDKAFKKYYGTWIDELFYKFEKKFIKPNKKKELIKMGLMNEDNDWKFDYSMEDDWIMNWDHEKLSGDIYNYNWRLKLVTSLMGVFNNDKDIVRKICSVIYSFIEPYKTHDYYEMLNDELENKIFKNGDFSLEPSHDILKELWNEWGLKIKIRRHIK